jgi:hypothetical protein
MHVEAHFSSLKDTTANEHILRFVLGGAVTVGAGLIARYWGPVIGGLFLAFPAIFPAGATLLEEHEVKKKARIGRDGRRRGREAAALDALGAALGAVGLGVFAVVVWQMLPKHSGWLSVGLALIAWMVVSMLGWVSRRLS